MLAGKGEIQHEANAGEKIKIGTYKLTIGQNNQISGEMTQPDCHARSYGPIAVLSAAF